MQNKIRENEKKKVNIKVGFFLFRNIEKVKKIQKLFLWKDRHNLKPFGKCDQEKPIYI